MTHLLLALILSFSVSFGEARRVTDGDPILVAIAQTAPAECVASFDSLNNTSDHDTDLLIVSGGQTFVLADVETGAHVTRTADVVLGDSVEIWLRPNSPNGRGKYVTSLGGKVTFECDETTTTTTPETTTTTVPETTTTTVPDITTTTMSVTSSTVPPTTVSSIPTTSTPPSTTTPTTVTSSTSIPVPSTIQTTTTWDPPPISLTVPTTPDTLPTTGADTTAAAYAGLLALLAGAGLVWTSREAKEC